MKLDIPQHVALSILVATTILIFLDPLERGLAHFILHSVLFAIAGAAITHLVKKYDEEPRIIDRVPSIAWWSQINIYPLWLGPCLIYTMYELIFDTDHCFNAAGNRFVNIIFPSVVGNFIRDFYVVDFDVLGSPPEYVAHHIFSSIVMWVCYSRQMPGTILYALATVYVEGVGWFWCLALYWPSQFHKVLDIITFTISHLVALPVCYWFYLQIKEGDYLAYFACFGIANQCIIRQFIAQQRWSAPLETTRVKKA